MKRHENRKRREGGFGVAELLMTISVLLGIAGCFSAFSHVILKNYSEMVTSVNAGRR